MRRALLAAALTALTISVGTLRPAEASTLRVSPVGLDLPTGQNAATLSLFNDDAAPSHLAPASKPANDTRETNQENVAERVASPVIVLAWADEAERELKKIPFFVRGKARRNTEKYAADNGLATITLETLYDAKAHYSR